MSDEPPRELKDDEKVMKHDYSIHQDDLMWSRIQTLIAVQGGTLAGMYTLASSWGLACALMVLGMILTGLLWWLAERDRMHSQRSLKWSGVPATIIDDRVCRGFKWLNGYAIIRIVFGLLLFANVVLIIWMWFCPPKPAGPATSPSSTQPNVSPSVLPPAAKVDRTTSVNADPPRPAVMPPAPP